MQKPTYKCGWGETKALFANIKGWSNFQAVFFISALTGEGVETLRDYLYNVSLQKVFSFKPKVEANFLHCAFLRE